MKSMTRTRLLGLLAATGLVVAGCGGGDIEETDTAAAGGEECGEFNMAINPWVGYEASAYVVGQLAANELGCTVEYKNLKEELAWQGFGTGEVDVVIENWGHDDLKKTYITDWQNLNKYADKFATSESGGKGQLLDGDPSFVTNDEALVENLDLDYKVVYAGSEAALIQTFRQAEANKEWVLGYFYDPQWFMSEGPLVKVDLPPYKPGCDVPPEEVDCDYPEYQLDKIASKEFMDSGSPAAELVQNFEWTNEEQNVVAKYIAQDGMSQEDAAEKWIEDNPDMVEAWLPS